MVVPMSDEKIRQVLAGQKALVVGVANVGLRHSHGATCARAVSDHLHWANPQHVIPETRPEVECSKVLQQAIENERVDANRQFAGRERILYARRSIWSTIALCTAGRPDRAIA